MKEINVRYAYIKYTNLKNAQVNYYYMNILYYNFFEKINSNDEWKK